MRIYLSLMIVGMCLYHLSRPSGVRPKLEGIKVPIYDPFAELVATIDREDQEQKRLTKERFNELLRKESDTPTIVQR